MKKTVSLDFDGVLHRYSKGWNGGEIYDDPCDGCWDALAELSANYRLVVCTARDEPYDAVWEWLKRHSLDQFIDEVTNVKPKAAVYIDDRAIHHVDWRTTMRTIGRRMEDDGWTPVATTRPDPTSPAPSPSHPTTRLSRSPGRAVSGPTGGTE